LIELTLDVPKIVVLPTREVNYGFQDFDLQRLEDDDDVLKWMKPASGQFRIEYQNGQNYEPDFVVE